jgi:hypothetical protein
MRAESRLTAASSRRRCPRILGLGSLIAAQLFAFGCGGSSGPTSLKCPSYAGTYTGTFSSSACGLPTDTRVVVLQLGCHVQSEFTGVGAVHGDLDPSGTWNFQIYPVLPCLGGVGGTANVNGSTITGFYTGTMTGAGCCSSFSISFTLTRQ